MFDWFDWRVFLFTFFVMFFAFQIAQTFGKEQYPGQYSQVDPSTRYWFESQKVPGTQTYCCSTADGAIVEEDIRDNEYWMRCPIDSTCPLKKWTKVPNNVIIKEPNTFGRPVVWWTQGKFENGIQIEPPSIRCYAPGALF